jgi:hypothetical protein
MFELLQRAGAFFGMGPVVVGNIGELRENREGADQELNFTRGELGKALVQRDFFDTCTVLAHGLAANMLDEIEIGLATQDIDLPLAVLLLDDLPHNAPQEANRFPAIEL